MQFGPLMSFWMVNGVCAMIPEEAAGSGRFFFLLLLLQESGTFLEKQNAAATKITGFFFSAFFSPQNFTF